MKKLLLTAAILALTGLQQPAFAHGDEEHGDHRQEATTEAAMPAMTAPEALMSIQSGMTTIGSQIESGTLDAIHEEIEKIDMAAQTLKEKATVTEDKKTRLESSLGQLSAQLDKLHEATDAKDIEKSKAEFKKAEGALKLVEAALK